MGNQSFKQKTSQADASTVYIISLQDINSILSSIEERLRVLDTIGAVQAKQARRLEIIQDKLGECPRNVLNFVNNVYFLETILFQRTNAPREVRKIVTHWTPEGGHRRRGRARLRWCEDLVMFTGQSCPGFAQNTELWKEKAEAFAQQWDTI